MPWKDAEDYQKNEFKKFLDNQAEIRHLDVRAIGAASRMEKVRETKKLIHLGSGLNIRQDSMAAWATKRLLQAMETIVPSSRSNAPRQLDFNFDTRTVGDMMNAGFWKKIGDLGIELGHHEISGSAALVDGQLALPPPPPPADEAACFAATSAAATSEQPAQIQE